MRESQSPSFSAPVRCQVLRYPHNERCELRSIDRSYKPKQYDIETVVHISNEPLIYNRLFKNKNNGQPYTPADAERFFLWAQEGWARHEWFVFLVRDSHKTIIAAIDIKSTDLDGAEVGYWASASSPGIMTNTLLQVCQLARDGGYTRLTTMIAPDNEHSIRVTKRSGFVLDGERLHRQQRYLQFSKVL